MMYKKQHIDPARQIDEKNKEKRREEAEARWRNQNANALSFHQNDI